MNKKVKNAYKGLILNFYYDMKKTAMIGIIIMLSIMVATFLLSIITIQTGSDTNQNSGLMLTGFIVMMISQFVFVIVSTSKVELYSKFSFPVSRRIYAISNFFVLVVGSLALLMIVTILSPVELGLYKLLSLFTDRFVYINNVTLQGFFYGIVTSWFMLIAISSVSYCVFIYIRKYLVATLLVLSILVTVTISFGGITELFKFFFLEKSMALLLVKLSSTAVIAHLLGYIPLKRLEVA